MEATNNPMICAHLCKNIIYDVVNYCDSFRADYQEERDSRLIQNDTGGSKTVLDRVQSDRGRLKTRILMRLRFIERRYFPFPFFSFLFSFTYCACTCTPRREDFLSFREIFSRGCFFLSTISRVDDLAPTWEVNCVEQASVPFPCKRLLFAAA